MTCRKISGSALIDYAIPTALVGIVVGLALYALNDSGNLSKFLAASSGIQVDSSGSGVAGQVENNSGFIGNSGTTPSGSEGDATISCDGTQCTINFGDYVLDGIPENFAEYIESSGTSGGTDLLADLLLQFVDNSDLPENEKKPIRLLANLGHEIASNELQIENIANDYVNGEVLVPVEVNDYLAEIDETHSGSARSQFISVLNSVSNMLNGSTNPQAPMMSLIINILAGEINTMAAEMLVGSANLKLGIGGEEIHAIESANLTLNPDTSNRTDLDSALICATGNGQDQGYNCE